MRQLILISAAAFVLTSCATASLVSSEPGKKVVITYAPVDSPEAKEKGMVIAREECQGKKPVMVKKEKVVVGSETESQATESPEKATSINLFTGKSSSKNVKTTSGTSKTTNTYEWQFTFECQ